MRIAIVLHPPSKSLQVIRIIGQPTLRGSRIASASWPAEEL